MQHLIPFSTPEIALSDSLAIVGSSSNILGKGMGSYIDSFDDVVRFNRSPIIGFESHVGQKTSLRVANQHVFGNVPYDRFHQNQDPNFIKNLRNTNIVHLGPNEGFWERKDRYIDPSCKAFKIEYKPIVQFSKENYSAKHLNYKNPTVGFLFICIAIELGITPNIFGFGVDEGSNISHYWERRENFSVCHEYNGERFLLRKFADQGKVLIH